MFLSPLQGWEAQPGTATHTHWSAPLILMALPQTSQEYFKTGEYLAVTQLTEANTDSIALPITAQSMHQCLLTIHCVSRACVRPYWDWMRGQLK